MSVGKTWWEAELIEDQDTAAMDRLLNAYTAPAVVTTQTALGARLALSSMMKGFQWLQNPSKG